MRLVLILFLTYFQQTQPTSSIQEKLDIPPFSIQIVPHSYPDTFREHASISLYFPKRQKFHVILTNISDEPIRIWEEWNSWGYFALSFQIELPDGRILKSEKFRCCWDKNFPSWIEIPPNRHYVFDVNFENDTSSGEYWQNSILDLRNDKVLCKIKAIYEVKETEESAFHKVWTGRAESIQEEILFYH